MSFKLAVLVVLISVFVGAQSQTLDADDIILKFGARFKIDIGGKLKAFLDAQISAITQILGAIGDLDKLKPDPKWSTTLVAQAQAALLKLNQEVQMVESKIKLLGDVVTNVADLKSAVLLECEDVRSDLKAVLLAGKANLKSKAQALVNIRNAINDITPLNFLVKLPGLRKTMADLRSKVDLADFLQDKIDVLQGELNSTLPSCEDIAKKAAAIASLDIKPNFDEIKSALTRKISNALDKAETRIEQLLKNMLQAKLKALGAVKVVVDEANKKVTITITGVFAKTTETLEEVKAIIERAAKAAVKAVLVNVDVDVSVSIGTSVKRQVGADVSFSVTLGSIKLSAELVVGLRPFAPLGPIVSAIADYGKKFAENLKEALVEVAAIKAALVQTTVDKIKEGINIIKQEIADIKVDEIKKALHEKLADLKAKVDAAKAAVADAVDATIDNVKQLLEVKAAQIEALVADLKANIAELKAKILAAKGLVASIELDIKITLGKIELAVSADVKLDLQAKLDALIADLAKAKAEVKTMVDNLVTFEKALVDAVIKFEKAKLELAAQIAKTVARKFAATAKDIQELVVAKEAQVTEELKDLAALVQPAIANLQAKWEKLASGFQGSFDISFDASLTTDVKIKTGLSVLLQSKFGAKVDLSIKKTTKRSLSESITTIDATIVSTDGSTADVTGTPSDAAAGATPAPAAGLSMGAIIGIAVGAVVLVVVVVVVVLLIKKGQDSKSGQLL